MSLCKPQNLSYDELVKTSTMFFVDEDYETKIITEVENCVNKLIERLPYINTYTGLKKYIQEDRDSLDNILNLLNISSEKFKRVVTMLRLDRGHVFATEWSTKKIRDVMLDNKEFMQDICDLLMQGAKLDKYKKIIPGFYRENFIIDVSTMARLANPDDLRRLVKRGIEGKYNNGIGDRLFAHVEKQIKDICGKEGLSYACKKHVPVLQRIVDFAIPNENNPKILIDVSFSVTTSSAQTKRKEDEKKAAKKLRDIYSTSGNSIILVNFVDGAGWVGRQSDLRDIHRCSDFTVNLKAIDNLDAIIHYYTN
jgi:hypothetical protein